MCCSIRLGNLHQQGYASEFVGKSRQKTGREYRENKSGGKRSDPSTLMVSDSQSRASLPSAPHSQSCLKKAQ